MSKPVIVTIPHRHGKAEAARRLRSGLAAARANFSALLKVEEESWAGDRLTFQVAILGQGASGTIDIAEDHVRLEVYLPWLLARLAERAKTFIRKEGTLMLEKK
jgi:hypothetical protein